MTAERRHAAARSRPEPPADAPALTPEVEAARRELELARAGLAASLDGLTDAVRDAADIPARVRRDPVKAAALAGGAGFLLVGGPRRVLRAVGRRLVPVRRGRYEGLLPDEVERILRDAGVSGDHDVRRALEADFAEYLRTKGRLEQPHSAMRSFWRTYDALIGPLGWAGARILVSRLMAAGRAREHGAGPGRQGEGT